MFKKILLGMVMIMMFAVGANAQSDIPEPDLSIGFEMSTEEYVTIALYDLDGFGWAELGLSFDNNEDWVYGFGMITNLDGNLYGFAGPVFENRTDDFDGTIGLGLLYSIPVAGDECNGSDRAIITISYDEFTGMAFGFGGQF